MQTGETCQRVVIIGAGFGGLTAAIRIARQRRGDECRITLIEKNTHHRYSPLTYEVATGDFDSSETDLAAGMSVAWDDLRTQFAPAGIDVLYEEAMGVDWAAREVLLSDDRRLGFDHLILATGGVPDYYGIEGLDNHAHQLYSVRGALAIRRHLHDLVIKRMKNEIPHIRVLIGGAGPSGCEFAAELGGFMRRLVRRGHLTVSDYSIEIVEASNRPLQTFHADMSAWARKRLEDLGVKLLLDTCIKGAHKDHVVLAPRPLREGEKAEDLVCDFRKESQKEVVADLVVWAGGVKASPLIGTLGLAVDRRGKVETDATLRVRGRDGVWALGDCASLINPKTKMPIPPLAQAAVKQGRILAENIMRAVRHEPLVTYEFPHMHAIVPLGGMWSLAEVFGVRFKGVLPGLFRLAADARYFFTTFPFKDAWKIFWKGALVYSRND